jgi:protein-S-isoprenylcysteine O-methyltransferase Ste14
MKRFVFFLYGVVCYLIFFVTFLYAIAFIGNILVPKSIDAGFQGGTSYAVLVDLLVLSLFAIQHSVMARQGFKKLWAKIVPMPIERSTYVLFSSIALIVLFYFWRPLSGTVWNVESPFWSGALTALFFVGFFIVLLATFLINHFNLFGLQQVYRNLKKQEHIYPKFTKPFFYRIVRHPLYLGFLIAFWATPEMTIGHLLFSVATTGYILVAIQLEEKDLVRFHGEAYTRYQEEVSQIIPMPRKKAVLADEIQENFSK